MNLFFPLTKVDAVQRLVYGVATAEVVDKANEIMDYESTVPLYKAWSDEIAKASDGKSLGNVREMHGKSAAGKLTEIIYNDDARTIEVCCKVVDDAAWEKVVEGVYTGFSQGGKYVRKWKDAADGGATRYTAQPAEVSLVDNPCVGVATFAMIKADGEIEEVAFKVADASENASAAAETVTADDVSRETVTEKRAPKQVWACGVDGHEHLVKADAVGCIAQQDALDKAAAASKGATDALDALRAVLVEKRGPAEEETDDAEPREATAADAPVADPAPEAVAEAPAEAAEAAAEADPAADPADAEKVTVGDQLAKGLYSVNELVSVISQLAYIAHDATWEADAEGDGSKVPAQLQAHVKALAETLKQLTAEEVDELVARLPELPAEIIVENAARAVELVKAAPADELAKVSKSKLQAMHDICKAFGAECAKDDGAEMAAGDDLGKLAELTAERDALTKQFQTIAEGVGELAKAVAELREEGIAKDARIAQLEAQPMPPKTPTRDSLIAVQKGAPLDGGAAGTAGEETRAEYEARLAKMRPEDRALEMTKLALRNPIPLRD